MIPQKRALMGLSLFLRGTSVVLTRGVTGTQRLRFLTGDRNSVIIDSARKCYESRHSGFDPESSPSQQWRALNATEYRLPPI
jgi:hypothetical protein